MVSLIRRKDADFKTEDVSSVGVAIGRAGQVAGKMMQGIGNRIAKQEQQEQKEYQSQVQDNIKTETARLNQQQKAFDASDKLVAADMAGRLENDLLRWNLEQRQNNPNYIGSPDHEKAMRDYYAKLSEQYSQGLGEVGKGEFTSKTQNAVKQMIGNDVKWAYQQKIKQGEESAKNIAQSMNDTAGMYGANGDIQGFKDSHKENREKLKDYIEEAAPNGAMPALYELDKKSLVNFYTNLAQTDPNKAKTLLENPELFKETVPEEMVDNVNNIVATSKTQLLNDKLEQVKAGLTETKQNSPAHREFEKEQKRLEKEIKKHTDEDYSEQSIQSIHKELENAVKPVLEKSLGENALIAKQEHETDKVARFQEFMTLPTPENLKWFEEDNQMSYAQPEENMSKIPSDFFSYGDQSTLKDYYDIYKGKYDSSSGLTDMINDLGIAEDDAQINFFDKIDSYKKSGVSESDAIQKAFDDNPDNKFGDVSTLKDFYDMYKGRYDDKSVLANANKKDLERIDELVSGGLSEEKAIEQVFNETEKNIAEKEKANRNKQLIDNMMKYRENFGNVSMVEISDYKGTKQMFDDLNNLAQCKIDEDGNCNEILNGALTTLNNAKENNVSESDYNNLQNITNNIMNDPDYKAQTQQIMALAKANILDHYAELFSPDVPETDKELQKPMDTTPIASGVMVDFKTKKAVDFNYAAASEKNKAKYNLVKNTYLGVMNDMSIGKFDDANEKIFALPYNVAKINYEGKLSPEIIAKFMEKDKKGGSPVEFMYNGYSFEYLGIDPTGTIRAKRRL